MLCVKFLTQVSSKNILHFLSLFSLALVWVVGDLQGEGAPLRLQMSAPTHPPWSEHNVFGLPENLHRLGANPYQLSRYQIHPIAAIIAARGKAHVRIKSCAGSSLMIRRLVTYQLMKVEMKVEDWCTGGWDGVDQSANIGHCQLFQLSQCSAAANTVYRVHVGVLQSSS